MLSFTPFRKRLLERYLKQESRYVYRDALKMTSVTIVGNYKHITCKVGDFAERVGNYKHITCKVGDFAERVNKAALTYSEFSDLLYIINCFT